MIRRLHIDRKGWGLLLCALIWGLVGRGVFERVSSAPNGAWHLLIPQDVRGGLWFASAAAALLAVWHRPLRPLAMGALVFMPMLRVLSYATGWVVSLIPGDPPGYPAGWYSAAIHAVMVLLVIYIASERDDTTIDDLRHVLERTDRGGPR